MANWAQLSCSCIKINQVEYIVCFVSFSFIFLATKRNMSESLFGCLCAVWHEFWCRKTCLWLLDCPWWRIACLVIIAACLHMVRYVMMGFLDCLCCYQLIIEQDVEARSVFLQTGSGKTYTMMGEIYEMEGNLNEDCGITPRIFEYLFSRIREVQYSHFYCFS